MVQASQTTGCLFWQHNDASQSHSGLLILATQLCKPVKKRVAYFGNTMVKAIQHLLLFPGRGGQYKGFGKLLACLPERMDMRLAPSLPASLFGTIDVNTTTFCVRGGATMLMLYVPTSPDSTCTQRVVPCIREEHPCVFVFRHTPPFHLLEDLQTHVSYPTTCCHIEGTSDCSDFL